MKIGMTGSRDGITDQALNTFRKYINAIEIYEAHHGDCIGADTIFHNLMESLNISIIIHPPSINTLRSYCSGSVVLPPKDYLSRNKDIVNDTDFLVAFPATKNEVLRSGTWSTIRYAQKISKGVIIFYPDGTYQ